MLFRSQQQIWDAVGRSSPILERPLYHPVLRTFLLALPFTFREVDAPAGTSVALRIHGEAGGEWSIMRRDRDWGFADVPADRADALATFGPETAWKLFTRRCTREAALERFADVRLTGDLRLAGRVLEMVSIMS